MTWKRKLCRRLAWRIVLPLPMVLLLGSAPLVAKTVVFWQSEFPTVASQPISRQALAQAVAGDDPVFAGLDRLQDLSTLADADLLVLPYGSAFPAAAWEAIEGYLRRGGNMLVLGGQPFRVPVISSDGSYRTERPQDTYSRALGFLHTYEVPVPPGAEFSWRSGYTFLHDVHIRAKKFYAVESQNLEGLGYMVENDGTRVAAPVIVSDRTYPSSGGEAIGSRVVMLDFEPESDYWDSPDGAALMRQAAEYARQGKVRFWTETLFAAIRRDEPPEIYVHLRRSSSNSAQAGQIAVEIRSGQESIASMVIPCSGNTVDAAVPFHRTLAAGFYTVRATYEYGGRPREFYRNGFWVGDEKALNSGPVLGVHGDFLSRDGKPFFPFGTNYFTTQNNGWDFSGPRNAFVWDRDFADMERHGVSFVRTGVWMQNSRFIDTSTGGADERFLRNLEAYLLCARAHKIAVNFTFFAFSPRSENRATRGTAIVPNPYLDAAAIENERSFISSVVERFKNVPWLSWDLINEPSFSNPNKIFKGNVPNLDPAELAAWRKWLKKRYGTLDALATAWSVTPQALKSFDSVPLPSEADLTYSRYGNSDQVRAVDYNLFAQDMFMQWVQVMVSAIRSGGSRQLIDVGQDEGGVTNRVLNQFLESAGVSFTVNHTYWQDDALLWDSVVSKVPGVPNIVGETGYQPVWDPNGVWRYDELTGAPLLERKWALGFAAGTSGVLQWDWAREPDFGMERSDGSAKIWESMMQKLGEFVQRAEPWATGLTRPQIALILPQSLQLSVWNPVALQAQQNAVRALYQYARAEAYPVGEYQIDKLGSPRLIILPSSFTLTSAAWNAILGRVREGSALLISGPFDKDAHFHPTGRQDGVGIYYRDVPLTIRNQAMQWPGGTLNLTYGGDKTTMLDRASMPGGKLWSETAYGKGKILFSAFPLELNDSLEAVGAVYRYALTQAHITPVYATSIDDPGVLICPSQFPHATLYVVTSESALREITFSDKRSGKDFSGHLAPGHAALLLIEDTGKVLATFNWTAQ